MAGERRSHLVSDVLDGASPARRIRDILLLGGTLAS